MKYAICQEMFEGWDWPRQCRSIAEIGYTGVEVAPFTLAARIEDVPLATRQTMRRQAEDEGLQIIGLHWLLAKTEGLHLTSPDAAVRKATAEYLVELGRACAELGGHLMVFGSPSQRSLADGVTREQGYDYAAEVFRASLPAISDVGVRICMEPLTPKETNFVNTCADALELMERVAHPALCLHQDVKAMLGAEREPPEVLIRRYAAHLGHFHVNDTNLLGPGMGETDFTPIFQALLDAGYDGWVSVEVFDYAPGAETIARESLRYMRDIESRLTS